MAASPPAPAPVPAPPPAPAAGPPTTFASLPAAAAFRVPLAAYLAARPEFGGVAVGAFVFDGGGRLLLVQRAAHDSMPLRWEVPGGACDADDATVLHAVARELWEESGLRATVVGALVPGGGGDRLRNGAAETTPGVGHVFFTRRGLRMCKYSFLTEVDGYDVRLDPNEHQAFLWVTEEEARARRCGDVAFEYTFREQMLEVYEAFRLNREKREREAKQVPA
ncbi:NUDIX hydrolase domain-like protein [Durotheca rogersii]|uniref:NUDIX hydrolase domain-like protein n=1 Tax=Durotheca rogersii TaxID=419775 RepID=UPI002220A742|nr:NUDIX hydrolase domain-like protein [Durotheca rogersii]KAI5856793.1 NUDIX hydrolase domain-like protein [Durotheca rogersii]